MQKNDLNRPLAEASNKPQMEYPPTKNVVQLDSDGYFIGLTQADLSPLEAEQGVYLLPSGAIDVTPPEVKAGYVAQWQNNEWHYLPDYRGAIAFSTIDQSEMLITEVGDVPEGYTVMVPSHPLQKWNGRDWYYDEEAQKILLDQQKEALIRKIAEKTDRLKSQILVGYPQAEIDSFYRQEREARAWILDNSIDTPMLLAIAENRGVPLEILAEKVIEKADQIAVMMGQIIGTRQGFEDRILSAKNQAELTACEQEIEQWTL